MPTPTLIAKFKRTPNLADLIPVCKNFLDSFAFAALPEALLLTDAEVAYVQSVNVPDLGVIDEDVCEAINSTFKDVAHQETRRILHGETPQYGQRSKYAWEGPANIIDKDVLPDGTPYYKHTVNVLKTLECNGHNLAITQESQALLENEVLPDLAQYAAWGLAIFDQGREAEAYRSAMEISSYLTNNTTINDKGEFTQLLRNAKAAVDSDLKSQLRAVRP